MKLAGIIFSNIYDSSLGDLTLKRTVASLPFGGRYRLVDFVLSNMVNSMVSSVGIITKYNYQSLMDHVGSGSEWDLARKNADFYILPPFATGLSGVYRGNLEALSSAVQFLTLNKPDYVIMCDTTVICNINFQKALSSHILSGADVTVISSKEMSRYENIDDELILKKGKDSIAEDMAIGQIPFDDALIGMGMYIVETKFLLGVIKNFCARGRFSFEKDFLLSRFALGELKVNVYEFKGPVMRNHSIGAYFKNNFRIMQEDIRNDVFNPNSPIYTKMRDETPTFYSETSSIQDSVIADGCTIEGTVKNSVIFADVLVKESARVKNSIVMQGSKIGAGAKIENAILDKNVTVSDGVTLIGSSNSPIIVHKGEVL